MEIPIIILTALVVLIILFLILREVMCWYYKINDIIKLQEDQLTFQKTTVQLLQRIADANNGSSPVTSNLYDTKVISVNASNPNELTLEEQETVNSLIPRLKLNQIIVLNTVSRIIMIIYKSELKPGSNWIMIKEYVSAF